MTQAQLLRLEEKAIIVASEYFNDVNYALDKDGRGMWLIVGNKIIPIDGGPELLTKEMNEVWQHMKPRG